MGITIDNSIRILEDSKRWRKKYGIFGSEEDDAINKLLDVAKKYQKIEKIIDDWNNQKINNIICCLDIKEVVEDGKID